MAQLARIRKRDGYTCQVCGIATRIGQVDHIIALVNGGDNSDTNQRLLCVKCHDDKTRLDLGYKKKHTYALDGFPIDQDHFWNK